MQMRCQGFPAANVVMKPRHKKSELLILPSLQQFQGHLGTTVSTHLQTLLGVSLGARLTVTAGARLSVTAGTRLGVLVEADKVKRQVAMCF